MRTLTFLFILGIAAICGCKPKEPKPERLILSYRIIQAQRSILSPQYVEVYEDDLITPELEAYEKESLSAGPGATTLVPLHGFSFNTTNIPLADLLSNQARVGWELTTTIEGEKGSIVFIFKRHAPVRIQGTMSTSTRTWFNKNTRH